MLDGLPILIVEDQPLIALELCEIVESFDGRVIGPIASVAEALVRVDQERIAGAILDANLLDRDVTPLALHLIDRGTPIVIYTGTGLPDELARAHPDLPMILKPARAITVLAILVDRIRAGE
jgi:DNA-binding NtrC family response regulator